jgi:hypothetical protein
LDLEAVCWTLEPYLRWTGKDLNERVISGSRIAERMPGNSEFDNMNAAGISGRGVSKFWLKNYANNFFEFMLAG